MRLRFVPADVTTAAVESDGPPEHRLPLIADLCRINALYAIMRAGSGHVGSSFSAMDIVTSVLDRRRHSPEEILYFSSKGHDAPGLYSAMAAFGSMDFEQLHRLRRHGGLPGHPDVGTPGVVTNTGSLGMGISKGKGLIYARRRSNIRTRVVVLTGDGELQEGQIWESLAGAARDHMRELTVVVDANGIQSDTWVSDISPLGDLQQKFRSFGWRAADCDGHDFADLQSALEVAEQSDAPSVIVARTVKGRGVGLMEGIPPGELMYQFHSGAPTVGIYDEATDELLDRCRVHAAALSLDLRLEALDIPDRPAPAGTSLIDPYADALARAADRHPGLVIFDADLVKDTGALPASIRHPERFIECGIAEQDMVSQAGATALAGLLPVVHSFACFLTTRANEQIFNNATERTKVIYVGSLAGALPGGPGHSHQSVRDIASMCSIPGLVAVEPWHTSQVEPLLRFLIEDADGPGYLRLVSIPVDLPFEVGELAPLEIGVGHMVRAGADLTLLAAGPVTVREAWLAAEILAADAISATVLATPWLNGTSPAWLSPMVEGRPLIVVDNHTSRGGLGQNVAADMLAQGVSPGRTVFLAVDDVAACGTNDEVLRHHGLNAGHIAAVARGLLERSP